MADHSFERIGDVGAHRGGPTRANLGCDAPRDLLRYRHGDLAFHTFILATHRERETSTLNLIERLAGRTYGSAGRLAVLEHRERFQVGRLEIRVELLRERGNDQVRHVDPRVRAQVASSERAGRLRH